MGNERKRLNPHDLAERRAKLLDLVRDGRYTWEQIADQCGYIDRAAAHLDWRRIRDARRKEVEQSLDEHRASQLEGLQEIRRVAVEVMRRDHVHVSGGKIVRTELDVQAGADGEPVYELGDPLLDDGPALAAIDRIAKIDAQIASLLGLNAPTRIEAEGELKVIVEGVDVEGLK